MITSKQQGTKTNVKNILLIPVLCILLAGCTFFRPPGKDLPPRGSIQPGETITVGRNQNVYGVARKHGVSMRELIVLNDLQAPFALREGQRIVLPAKTQDMAPAPAAAPVSGIEEKPLEPLAAPVTSTPLEAPQTLPPPAQSSPSQQATILPPQPPSKPVQTTVVASAAKPALTPPPAKPVETPEAPKSDITFTWPVQGPILASFGPKGQGTNNDGINIGAPKGAPVLAAAGGIVVYADNEMKGFGNLVLIRHENGWVTAYAHLDRMMVARDTVVAPGDMIGTVGSTGGVAAPQLHFETRRDGKAVDPQTVIKKS